MDSMDLDDIINHPCDNCTYFTLKKYIVVSFLLFYSRSVSNNVYSLEEKGKVKSLNVS